VFHAGKAAASVRWRQIAAGGAAMGVVTVYSRRKADSDFWALDTGAPGGSAPTTIQAAERMRSCQTFYRSSANGDASDQP